MILAIFQIKSIAQWIYEYSFSRILVYFCISHKQCSTNFSSTLSISLEIIQNFGCKESVEEGEEGAAVYTRMTLVFILSFEINGTSMFYYNGGIAVRLINSSYLLFIIFESMMSSYVVREKTKLHVPYEWKFFLC